MGVVALLSPDTTRVAAQRDGQLVVWTRAGVKLRATPNRSPLRGALAKGALVGVVSGKLVLRRGDRYQKTLRLRLPKGVLTVLRTAVSPDGRVAAVLYAVDGGAGDATAVSFFDGRSGRGLGRVVLARGRLFGVSFSRDARRVALFGDIGRQTAWVEVHTLLRARGCRAKRCRVKEGARATIRRLSRWQSARDKTVFSTALSPDGQRVAVGAGRRLVLLEAKTGKLLRSRPTRATLALFPPRLRRLVPRFPGAHQLVFSHDGKSLAVLHAFGVSGVARWDVAGLRPRAWLTRPQSQGLLRQLAFTRGGALWLVTAGLGASVELFEASGRRFVRRRSLALPGGS